MDNGHPRGHMGMGVALIRHAMGCPAGVTNSDVTFERVFLEHSGQIDELALGAAAVNRAIDECRDPCGVIAAIFQPLQSFEQPWRRIARAENSDNPAHLSLSPFLRATPGPHTSSSSA
jgi:hypothetical protein